MKMKIMFWKKKYKEYSILFSPEAPLQYAIAMYSGNKELFMLVDTGATISYITKESLEGCDYKNLKSSTSIVTANGVTKSKQIQLNFSLESDIKPKYSTIAFVASKKDTVSHFQSVDLNGIIGMDFLQFCLLDFIKLKLKVYQL